MVRNEHLELAALGFVLFVFPIVYFLYNGNHGAPKIFLVGIHTFDFSYYENVLIHLSKKKKSDFRHVPFLQYNYDSVKVISHN